jgi:DNA-binding GntR family transcriptional regulator
MPGELIEADMRRRLTSGEWQSGEALPTLQELADHYRAARGTVAKVLRKLADDGLLVVRPRWGTFKA